MSVEVVKLVIDGDYEYVEVEFNYTAGLAGVTHLEPSDCYPEEPAEYDIGSASIGGIELTLTDELKDEIIEALEAGRVEL